jgi:hypothetical protein
MSKIKFSLFAALLFLLVAPAILPAQTTFVEEPYAPVRFGLKGDLGLGFYFPGQLNDLVLDEWNDLTSGVLTDEEKPTPFIVNIPFRMAGFIRLQQRLQGELWVEGMAGNSSGWNVDILNSSYGSSQREHDEVTFTPSYSAIGISGVLLAGEPDARIRPTVGLGIGNYSGKVKIASKGYIRGTSSDYSWDDEYEYKGSTIGVSGLVGLTLAVSRNLEFDGHMTLRYANIKELKRGGAILFNRSKGEKVGLNLTGIDFRLGASIILP